MFADFAMSLFFADSNPDFLFDNSTESPLANQSLELRFPNGSVYASTTTDFNGAFSVTPTVIAPDQYLDLVDPSSGTTYGNLILDSTGAGSIDVPLTASVTTAQTMTVS